MSTYEFPSPRIESFEELNQFLEETLFAIHQAIQSTETLDLRESHREPERPRNGLVVFADGTDWNPGSGRGLYVYDGGWVRLVKSTELGGATWTSV